jgi:hypothetical protein
MCMMSLGIRSIPVLPGGWNRAAAAPALDDAHEPRGRSERAGAAAPTRQAFMRPAPARRGRSAVGVTAVCRPDADRLRSRDTNETGGKN